MDHFSTGANNTQAVNSGLKEVGKILRVLEARLRNDHRHLVGYGPSIADVSISSVLTMPFWPVFRDYLAPNFPAVTRWLRDCQERFDFASVGFLYGLGAWEDPVLVDYKVQVHGRFNLLFESCCP